jgi:hypothetical protein
MIAAVSGSGSPVAMNEMSLASSSKAWMTGCRVAIHSARSGTA